MAKWWYCEDVFPLAPIAMEAHYRGFNKPAFGRGYSYSIMFFDGTHARLYWDEEDCGQIGEAALKLVKQKEFIGKLRKGVFEASEKLMEFSSEVENAELSRKSDGELIQQLRTYMELHAIQSSFGSFPNALDYAARGNGNLLLELLKGYVREKIRDEENITHAISIMTTPEEETFPAKEHNSFLNIAIEFSKKPEIWNIFRGKEEEIEEGLLKKYPEALERIDMQVKEYAWISFLFIGPIKWTREHYISLLAGMARENYDFEKEMEESRKRVEGLKVERRKLDGIFIEEEWRHLFFVASELAILKMYRKDVQSYGWYALHLLAMEAARRLKISEKQINFLLPSEIIASLESHKIDVDLIDERSRRCAYVLSEGKFRLISGKEADQLKEKLESLHIVDEKVEELRGECACVGSAKGKVKIINYATDLKKDGKGRHTGFASNPAGIGAGHAKSGCDYYGYGRIDFACGNCKQGARCALFDRNEDCHESAEGWRFCRSRCDKRNCEKNRKIIKLQYCNKIDKYVDREIEILACELVCDGED